ncbi:MAG: hypothetical protein K2L97_08980 [Muribaculaceae bacterium]|nr:hypothetical protein [Muribaculaceae bacterium]
MYNQSSGFNSSSHIRGSIPLYIEETDDSLISTAVDYYSAHPFDSQMTSTNFLMLALYHQGVIRENDNNLIMALRSYLKAEGEAIQRNDHYFLGYIYRHFCLLHENIHAGKEDDPPLL